MDLLFKRLYRNTKREVRDSFIAHELFLALSFHRSDCQRCERCERCERSDIPGTEWYVWYEYAPLQYVISWPSRSGRERQQRGYNQRSINHGQQLPTQNTSIFEVYEDSQSQQQRLLRLWQFVLWRIPSFIPVLYVLKALRRKEWINQESKGSSRRKSLEREPCISSRAFAAYHSVLKLRSLQRHYKSSCWSWKQLVLLRWKKPKKDSNAHVE